MSSPFKSHFLSRKSLYYIYTEKYQVILNIKKQFEYSCSIFRPKHTIIEPVHEISNNGVCGTSKASDQPAHTRSLIRAFASRLSILCVLSY